MADTKTVNTGNTTIAGGAPAPLGAYPHAKRAGDLLFLSGIGPRAAGGGPIPGTGKDADGNVITTDIEAQCHAVFANVRSVLESAGAAWEDLVASDQPTLGGRGAEYRPQNPVREKGAARAQLPAPLLS